MLTNHLCHSFILRPALFLADGWPIRWKQLNPLDSSPTALFALSRYRLRQALYFNLFSWINNPVSIFERSHTFQLCHLGLLIKIMEGIPETLLDGLACRSAQVYGARWYTRTGNLPHKPDLNHLGFDRQVASAEQIPCEMFGTILLQKYRTWNFPVHETELHCWPGRFSALKRTGSKAGSQYCVPRMQYSSSQSSD